jgi:hypothetical protein
MCEHGSMKAAGHGWPWWVAMVAVGIVPQVMGQSTNDAGQLPARPERPTQRFEESAFRIVPERNIFNANRSGGGQVRGPSRRPSSVEYFALVGTMDYEKGIFAFFEGSSSQFTKVLKPSEVIAGHKLLEISANGVKLEADGKKLDLPVGSQMRREDEGAWQMSESRGGISMASSAEGEASSRNNRSDRGDFRSRREDSSVRRNDTSANTSRPVTSAAPSTGNEDEVLKRLMERRERESK